MTQAFFAWILFSLLFLPASPLYAKAERKREAPEKPVVASTPQEPAPPTKISGPRYPDPAVAEIHRELEEIIRVHQTLQIQYRGQIREIQRITDQARAHQRLLRDLEAVRLVQQQVQAVKGLDELVRLEKIRLIREQTRQNRTLLEGIQQKETKKKSS